MSETYKVITPDYVSLVITSSGDEYACTVERRFPKSLIIAELKGKLELQTGGNAASMVLELYTKDDVLVTTLSDNNALLGSYPVDNGMRLHVVDNFTLRNEFEDLSKVEKFDLSIDDYSKRTDTVKSFLVKNKLGKYNEEEMAIREKQRLKELEEEEKIAKTIGVGDRCEISVPGQPQRRGTVKYVGEVNFKKGWWIGVQYDEPLGKNNGTVEGETYFECPDKYGGFVRPTYIKVGEFPVEDYDLDEEI